MGKVEAAEAKLAAARGAHAAKVAKDLEAIAEREQKVRKREVDIHDREGRLAGDQERVEKAKADLRERSRDPNVFGTLAREPA